MLHILWLILQILLFTILVLLGLAVALVLMLLFVPVRYQVYAEKHENFICKLKASWMGFVFCFKARYDADGFVYWLRSFGGTLVSNENGFTGEADSDTAEEQTDKEKKKKLVRERKAQKKAEKEQRKLKKTQQKQVSKDDAKDTDASNEDTAIREEHRGFAEDDSEFQKQPESLFSKLGKELDKLVIAVNNKVSAFINRIRRLKTKAGQYKKFITANSTKQSLAVVKLYVIKLLAHLNPTKINGHVTYGAGDPAATGEQLGALSVFLPLFANKIDITPDFSEKVLVGDIFIKGRVRVYNILYCGLKIYFNKYVKHSIAYFKKISGGTK